MKVVNTEIRAELNNNLFYVRNYGVSGGVIDAIVKTEKVRKAVTSIIENAGTKTFSQIWDECTKVKGLKMEHRSN